MRPHRYVAALALILAALAAPRTAAASARYTATINGESVDPPVVSSCVGFGTTGAAATVSGRGEEHSSGER